MVETKEILPEQHYRYNHNLPPAEELMKEHDNGSSWKEIASKYNVPENTIWSRIKNYKDTLAGKRKPLKILSGEDNGKFRADLDVQKMIEDYQSGIGTPEIAQKYNCGKTTVKRKLKEAGITLRDRSQAQLKGAEPKPRKEPKIKIPKEPKIEYPLGEIIDNKYSQAYWRIIESAKLKNVVPDAYYEIHHAHPKALGGSDDLNNLVNLTPKEHYVCHHLLTKCTAGDDKRRMLHAWLLMAYCDKTGDRYVPAVQYDHLRRELAIAGKSEEHKAKMSEAAKKRIPRKFSEEAKKNMSEARKKNWAEGKFTNDHFKQPRSEQHKENIRKSATGRVFDEKTKEKMAEAQRRRWAKRKEGQIL